MIPHKLLSYRAGNIQGLGMRKGQEDNFAFANIMDVTKIKSEGMLAVVCDGMGGMADGRAAADAAIASILSDFEGMDRSRDISLQLKESILKASDAVYELLDGDGGTTVVACIFFNERLHFSSVGDSFLYLSRNGELTRLNEEHTRRNEILRAEVVNNQMRLEATDADPEAGALTQFVGMEGRPLVDGTMIPLELQEGDRILLCSDGVGGVLSEPEISTAMYLATPMDVCNELESMIGAKQLPYQDNYTAIVIECRY